MNICHVVCVSKPYQSGISNAALRLAAGSAAQGHNAVILTPRYETAWPLAENISGTIIKRFPTVLKAGKAAVMGGLISEIAKYDIVHLHFPFYGSHEQIWFAKKVLKQKFKLVLHYHMNTANLPLAFRVFSLPTRLMLKSLLNSADAILCSSRDYFKDSLSSAISVRLSAKLYELPFGIDIGKFVPAPKINSERKYKQLLFVGALDKPHYFKGLDLLLSALALLDSDFHLKVVGTGDRKEFFCKTARQLNIADRVEFAGKLDDNRLIQAYQDADALVLPSINRHEAFGIVLVEAMACGTPVIASALPGVRTVFTNQQEGLLIAPGDVQDLKMKIIMMLADKGKYNRMAVAARRLAETKYSDAAVFSELAEVYSTLL